MKLIEFTKDIDTSLDEDLKQWFKQKWVRFGPDGKIRGDCARGSSSEGKPKCLPQAKAQALGKKGRASSAAKKRREDPNAERRGAAKNVATKANESLRRGEYYVATVTLDNGDVKKIKVRGDEGYDDVIRKHYSAKGHTVVDIDMDFDIQGMTETKRVARKQGQPANSKKHSDLYTDENPQGTITGLKFATAEDARASVSKIRASGRSHAHKIQAAVAMEQRAKVAGKAEAASVYRKYINSVKKTDEQTDLDEACWKGYHKEGMKTMFGKKYPNCVKNKSSNEAVEQADIDEAKRKKKSKKKSAASRYFFPGYGYYGGSGDSGEGGGDGGGGESKSFDKANKKTDMDEACWDSHKQVGMKNKGGRQVPNCVPKESVAEGIPFDQCPSCGDKIVHESELTEKQDACYHKVKSRYKVWPSAYASGALVQCRKKGAANWGNKSESTEQELDEKWSQKYKSKINCSNPKGFSQKAHCAGKNESMEESMENNLNELDRILELSGLTVSADEQFDMIEEMVNHLAEQHGVDAEAIWEDFESVEDDELLETAAWRRKEGKSKKGGLNAKGVASYRRENPGSKLQTAVTTKPSKLKPGSKAAKRRKSFCARMGGVKGPMKKPNGKPTRKALALRKWNCE